MSLGLGLVLDSVLSVYSVGAACLLFHIGGGWGQPTLIRRLDMVLQLRV